MWRIMRLDRAEREVELAADADGTNCDPHAVIMNGRLKVT
jgi:hypothetical protein